MNCKCVDKTVRNNRIYRPVQSDIWPEDQTQSNGQMLPILHKHFAMIKQKSGNERMEQSSLSLKWS